MVSLAMELGNAPDLITSVYDGTALIAAAHLGHHEVVARLVAGGAPLDHVNNLAWTALIEAVVLGDGGPDHVKTVQILVEAGADNRSEIVMASPVATRHFTRLRRNGRNPEIGGLAMTLANRAILKAAAPTKLMQPPYSSS